MSTEKVKLDQNSIVEEFASHFSPEQNMRILFSAPFGAGKSYFFNEFFGIHKEYVPIRLFPVDYPVAANGDLLEVIKHEADFEGDPKTLNFQYYLSRICSP